MNHSPSDILALLEEAEKLKLNGKHEEAIELLESLIIEDPTNVSILEEIADNELSLEHHDRAINAAKQALSFDEDSYTALYILGFLSSQKEQWIDSITYLTKANKLKPNNPEILRCLGWSLFCTGKRTQGIVTLERALNLDADNPLTLCDLGVTYLQAHDFKKAKALFNRTLDIDPFNARAKECIVLVQKLETHSTKKISTNKETLNSQES